MTLLLLVLPSLFASPATANDPPLYHLCRTSAENVTSNRNYSTYNSNLNLLFSTLFSNGSTTGFATSTTGKVPDRTYGITLCRGDTDVVNCSSCILTAISDIRMLCPKKETGVIWYDYCQLYYSSEDILHPPVITYSYIYKLVNPKYVSDDQLLRYKNLLLLLMETVSDLAVRNTSRFFATGEASLTTKDIVYGQVQCALDLSVIDCRSCLQELVGTIGQDDRKQSTGRRAMGLWCNMRYEFYKFYNDMSMLQLSSGRPLSSRRPPFSPSTTNLSMPNATHPWTDLSHGGISLGGHARRSLVKVKCLKNRIGSVGSTSH